jgi:membrane protease YdiL (CAAX protease family)
MFSSLKDSTKSIAYTVIVLLLAIGFSFIPNINTFAYMMTPTIAVLIMMLVVTRDGYRKEGWKKLGLHKLGIKSWGFALVVPVIPLVAGFAVAYAADLSSFQPGSDFEGFSWKVFPLLVVFLYIKAVLTQSMGEELGWRGYLLPAMLGCMGRKKAMLVNGAVHGVWHFPLILNTEAYHSGENLSILLPLTVLSTIFLGPVIGEIRMRTGSVWTSSMIHTTHNLVWLIFAVMTVEHSEAAKYISGDMSIIVVLFYAVLTFFMWRRQASRN